MYNIISNILSLSLSLSLMSHQVLSTCTYSECSCHCTTLDWTTATASWQLVNELQRQLYSETVVDTVRQVVESTNWDYTRMDHI